MADDIVSLRVHISEKMAEDLDRLRGLERGVPSRPEFLRRIAQSYIDDADKPSNPTVRVIRHESKAKEKTPRAPQHT